MIFHWVIWNSEKVLMLWQWCQIRKPWKPVKNVFVSESKLLCGKGKAHVGCIHSINNGFPDFCLTPLFHHGIYSFTAQQLCSSDVRRTLVVSLYNLGSCQSRTDTGCALVEFCQARKFVFRDDLQREKKTSLQFCENQSSVLLTRGPAALWSTRGQKMFDVFECKEMDVSQ